MYVILVLFFYASYRSLVYNALNPEELKAEDPNA
jgi:hypothetical protein